MGANVSKGYSSYKLQPKVCKLLLDFIPNGPHKITFEIIESLKIESLTIFFLFSLIWDPIGVKILKTLPRNRTQTFPNWS